VIRCLGGLITPFSRAWIYRGRAIGMVLVYLGMSLVPTLVVPYAHRDADDDRILGGASTHIPSQTHVMAYIRHWTGRCDRQVISSKPPYYSDRRPVGATVAHINRYRPGHAIQSSIPCPGLEGPAHGPKTCAVWCWGKPVNGSPLE